MIASVLVGGSVAAAITGGCYILLVAVSFFVVMPAAAQSGVMVGSLLAVIFTAAFVVALRKMLAKDRLAHRH
ncbi:MAG: hypothetical protein ABIR86_04910 [Sphingomicrobium sp.]